MEVTDEGSVAGAGFGKRIDDVIEGPAVQEVDERLNGFCGGNVKVLGLSFESGAFTHWGPLGVDEREGSWGAVTAALELS